MHAECDVKVDLREGRVTSKMKSLTKQYPHGIIKIHTLIS